jgi:transcriptional regulator with XRE-family HTH domain
MTGMPYSVKHKSMTSRKKRFLKLLERRSLTQEQFAELVKNGWLLISGRTLSRQAVSAWINGKSVPRLSPAETLVILEILGCTLTELAIAFSDDLKDNDPPTETLRERDTS